MSTLAAARVEAATLDANDVLAPLRAEFLIPTREQISSASLIRPHRSSNGSKYPAAKAPHSDNNTRPVTYFVGNSLGLQPRRTWDRIRTQLDVWATRGVTGHFSALPVNPTKSPRTTIPWVDVDAYAAELMAPIVGASTNEVAVMQTLSANLHLLLCKFFRPDLKGRHQILIEEKAFPSDHVSLYHKADIFLPLLTDLLVHRRVSNPSSQSSIIKPSPPPP